MRRAEPGRDTEALVGLRWAWGLETGAAPADAIEPSPEFVAHFATWVGANAATHVTFLALDGDRPVARPRYLPLPPLITSPQDR